MLQKYKLVKKFDNLKFVDIVSVSNAFHLSPKKIGSILHGSGGSSLLVYGIKLQTCSVK